MKVAVVITIKNEARLIRQNALYHLGIGVVKVFVYFDQTTDNGKQTLLDLDAVDICDSVKAESFKHLPYLEKFWSNAREHHTARQCLNTYDAVQRCKVQHIDWLISLDADELFLATIDKSQTLDQFFGAAAKQGADIVNLKPMEVIARKMSYQNVMQEETLFKTQKNFHSKFDQIYQNIYDPYHQNYKKVSYWLGHTMGKAAIRVRSSVIPHNVHRCVSINGDELKRIDMGYLLHYHNYDFEDFIKKYKNFKEHPDSFLSGNKIEDLKSLWINLVNDPAYSKAYLEAYFEKNLLFDSFKLNRLYTTRLWNIIKRREAAVINVDLPKSVLTKSDG